MVLQLLGLFMHFIPAVAQRLNEVELQETVVTDDLQGDTLSGSSQLHTLVGRMLHQIHLGQLLDHPRHRGWSGATQLSKQRCGNDTLLLLERVDSFEIILNSGSDTARFILNSHES